MLVRVSTADFIKNFGTLADEALTAPVRITRHGRDRLVMVSAAEYDRLKRRDRRVAATEELTDEELALISNAEVPAGFSDLDGELADWKP
jgi:prevent-host-death family protein